MPANMPPGTTSGHGARGRAPSGEGVADTRWPRVGVAVLVVREGRVLLGRRIGKAHGRDTWQCPGGHLEPFETIEACAAREVREETGLAVRMVAQAPYTNDFFEAEAKHYVTLFVLAVDAHDVTAHAPWLEPAVCEPDKCAEWQWFVWEALPTPLFPSLQQLQASGYQLPSVP